MDELTIALAKLETRFDRQDQDLREILSHVKETNGRVTKLEQNEAVTKALQERTSRLMWLGIGTAFSAVGGVLLLLVKSFLGA